jgi:hypothetical protein
MPRRENRRGGHKRRSDLGSGPGPGKSREPSEAGARLRAPTTVYSDADGAELELRGSLSPGARSEYAAALAGGLDREDAYQRATELLFERLVVSWTVAGLRIDRQRELLGRYRLASAPERQFVRESLRRHLAENFPEMQAP